MNTVTSNQHPLANATIAKRLLLLTGPIALTFIFIMLSGTMDTVLSSQYDASTLAAISIATTIGTLPLAAVNGIMYTAVPQYTYLKEQNKTDDIFNLVIEFLIISFSLSTLITLLFIFFVPYALNVIGIDPSIIPLIKIYLTFLLPYLLGMIAFNNLYYFSESFGFPVFATITVFFSLAIQGLFIYILVFSNWVQQSWGIAGFGLASVIFAWSKFFILLPIILMHKSFRSIWRHPIQRLNLSITRMVGNTIKGIPISLSFFSQWGSVLIMGLMIARLGIAQAGANAIVYSIMALSIVIVLALGRAIAILVAQYQDQKARLIQTLFVGTALAVILLSISCLVLLAFSPAILALYKANEVTLRLIDQVYPYMIWTIFFLGLSNVFAFALKGLSDFLAVFLIAFVTTWLFFMPLGYLLSNTDFIYPAQGISGWWQSLSITTALSSALVWARLYTLVKRVPQTMPLDAPSAITEKSHRS